MIRHILVTLDGSEYSERALDHARELAQATGARLTLFSVVLRPDSPHTPTVPKLDEDSRKRALAYLVRKAGPLREAGLENVATEVRFGEPASLIADLAAEQGVDLIAMSTHGLGASGRYALGSIAFKVLMTAPCPVFMVRIPEMTRASA